MATTVYYQKIGIYDGKGYGPDEGIFNSIVKDFSSEVFDCLEVLNQDEILDFASVSINSATTAASIFTDSTHSTLTGNFITNQFGNPYPDALYVHIWYVKEITDFTWKIIETGSNKYQIEYYYSENLNLDGTIINNANTKIKYIYCLDSQNKINQNESAVSISGFSFKKVACLTNDPTRSTYSYSNNAIYIPKYIVPFKTLSEEKKSYSPYFWFMSANTSQLNSKYRGWFKVQTSSRNDFPLILYPGNNGSNPFKMYRVTAGSKLNADFINSNYSLNTSSYSDQISSNFVSLTCSRYKIYNFNSSYDYYIFFEADTAVSCYISFLKFYINLYFPNSDNSYNLISIYQDGALSGNNFEGNVYTRNENNDPKTWTLKNDFLYLKRSGNSIIQWQLPDGKQLYKKEGSTDIYFGQDSSTSLNRGTFSTLFNFADDSAISGVNHNFYLSIKEQSEYTVYYNLNEGYSILDEEIQIIEQKVNSGDKVKLTSNVSSYKKEGCIFKGWKITDSNYDTLVNKEILLYDKDGETINSTTTANVVWRYNAETNNNDTGYENYNRNWLGNIIVINSDIYLSAIWWPDISINIPNRWVEESAEDLIEEETAHYLDYFNDNKLYLLYTYIRDYIKPTNLGSNSYPQNFYLSQPNENQFTMGDLNTQNSFIYNFNDYFLPLNYGKKTYSHSTSANPGTNYLEGYSYCRLPPVKNKRIAPLFFRGLRLAYTNYTPQRTDFNSNEPAPSNEWYQYILSQIEANNQQAL